MKIIPKQLVIWYEPIDILFRVHIIGDQIRIDFVVRIQWHLHDDSMHIWIIIQFVQLKSRIHTFNY